MRPSPNQRDDAVTFVLQRTPSESILAERPYSGLHVLSIYNQHRSFNGDGRTDRASLQRVTRIADSTTDALSLDTSRLSFAFLGLTAALSASVL